MGDGHHLYPRAGRLPLPLRDNRPLQPLCRRMVAVEHDDVGMVQEDRGGRHRRTWRARDPEHRPGKPVHLHRVYGLRDKGKRDQAEHGRKGKVPGQYIHRTALAQRQVRARISLPGRRRATMLSGTGGIF